MKASLLLGSEIDIASGDEVRAAAQDTKDGILSFLASPPARANRRRIPASYGVSAAATGTWVIDFGSPQGGYLWYLVEVVLTGNDDRTAIAGSFGTLYIGTPARQLTNTTIIDTPLLGSLVRPGVALPTAFTFSGEQFPVHDGENLFAIIYSPTTAVANVSGVATVMEVPDDEILRNRT